MARLSLSNPADLLDRTYDLEATDEEWVEGLTAALSPTLRHGAGIVGSLMSLDDSMQIHAFETLDSADSEAELFAWAIGMSETDGHRRADRDALKRMFPTLGATAASLGVGTSAETPHVRVTPVIDKQHRDLAYMVVPGESSLLSFTARSCEPLEVSQVARRRWRGAHAHVSAVLRLRERLRSGVFDEESVAWFDPSGECVDANGAVDVRCRLQKLVRAWEASRCKRREKQRLDAADYWERVLSGQWALLDRFDSDGRRFIVAVPVGDGTDGLRGLSKRESEVMGLLGEGYANKVIAIELGISESAVASHLGNIFKKLGISDRSSAVHIAQALRAA